MTSHYKNLTANTRRSGNRVTEHYRRNNPVDIEPNIIVLPDDDSSPSQVQIALIVKKETTKKIKHHLDDKFRLNVKILTMNLTFN